MTSHSMRHHAFRVAAAITLAVLAYRNAFAQNTPPTAAPQAGTWEVTTTMKGAPSGDKSTSRQACLTAAQVNTGLEQALLDLSASGGTQQKGSLKCAISNLTRDGTKSAWQSTCEGPRDAMQGSGSGTLNAASAEINQSFEIKAPMGTVKLQQVLQAKRLGDC
jgi:hypothetical protein